MQKQTQPVPVPTSPAVVAIPVRDEAEEIGPCLLALAAQRAARIEAVVLCLNNCRDGTVAAIRAIAAGLPFALHVVEVTLPEACACAGRARRIAMERAADLAGGDGVLLTTDADARVAQDWVAANLAALRDGAEAVAGRAVIEPEGAKRIPAHLHAIDARECAYAALLDEIRTRVDPQPDDPWPRHDEESGASIAVTLAAYRRVGGMPAAPLGEDRAFFDALRRVDARIRHAPDIAVTVSARTEGRARGGMADTMRRRIERPDPFLDARLEPALDALRRARLRRLSHQAWSIRTGAGVPQLCARLGLAAACVADDLATPHFGMAWEALQAASPVLRQRASVALEDLPQQTARAIGLRERLRRAGDRAGIGLPAAAQ